MEIWGFSGKLSTGKNYVSERMFLPMLDEKKTIMLAFANHFKIDAIVKQNLDRNKVFGKKDDHTRRVLQIMGTEEGRNKYGENIWINLAEEWRAYYENLGYQRAIIFDVRFPNEVEYVQKKGGKVIRIDSPERHLAGAKKEAEANGVDVHLIMGHASEVSLDGYEGFDLIVKNDPEDKSLIQIRNYIREYQEQNKPENVFFVDVDDTIGHCHIYYEETIDKVEALLGTFTKNTEEEKHETFRGFIKQMRHRHDTSIYQRSRFPEDLRWAIEQTINKIAIAKDEDAQIILDLIKAQLGAQAEALGYGVFDYDYEPLPGALNAIAELRKLGKVVLFTLGDRLEQVKKIAGLGLSDLDFVVTHSKCAMTFHGLLRKFPAKNHYMIGDNLGLDILAGIEAGIPAGNTYWINPPYRRSVVTDDLKPYNTRDTLVGAVSSIQVKLERLRIINKWENFGLLKGLNGLAPDGVGALYESLPQQMLYEAIAGDSATDGAMTPQIDTIQLPIGKRVYAKLIPNPDQVAQPEQVSKQEWERRLVQTINETSALIASLPKSEANHVILGTPEPTPNETIKAFLNGIQPDSQADEQVKQRPAD
jgi:FMN phosphatase YigB (HAD superfamily)